MYSTDMLCTCILDYIPKVYVICISCRPKDNIACTLNTGIVHTCCIQVYYIQKFDFSLEFYFLPVQTGRGYIKYRRT